MKKGDAVAKIAQPIAKASDWLLGTNLKNCPACNWMKNGLNSGQSFSDAIYDRFFKKVDERKR